MKSEYTLKAEYKQPELKSCKNLYRISNQYRNFPQNIKIYANSLTILDSNDMATKGHDLVHILSGFYLDKLLDIPRIDLTPVQEMLDISFGAGCISFSKKDFSDPFDQNKSKQWIYRNIFWPMLRLEEKKSGINCLSSQVMTEFENNNQLVENLQKLAKAALDLGVIFRSQNKEQSRYMNLIYFQFSKWKDRVKDNIREFNQKNHQNKDEFEKYLTENQDDFTFTVEISSLDTNIDLAPYNDKIPEIKTLISQIGDFEFTFAKSH